MTNTIAIWHGEITQEQHPVERYSPLLDQNEHIRTQQFKSSSQQALFIASHGILRTVLSEILNEKPETIQFSKGQHGKPYLTHYPDTAFNLSHTANHLMIAIAHKCHLGVDIERCKPRNNLPALVNKCFSSTEAVYWNSLSEQLQIPEFYRFWTGKEAFVKATGRGIALGLQHCVLNPAKEGQFESIPDEFGSPNNWLIHSFQLPNTLSASVVVDKTTATFSDIQPL